MYTKSDFLASAAHETAICRHLHSKLDPSRLDFRPGANMRSTLELMRYLTYCGSGPVQALIEDDWTRIGVLREAADTMAAGEFPARMDAQLARMGELLADLDDDELRTRQAKLPWGVTVSLGRALVDAPLKFLAAYRLQLFLHIKASGRSELSTPNAWRGAEPPPK